MFIESNRGQVWIETVVYTLIGLSLLGLVLGLVTPKIQEYKDRAIIEQTINSLNLLDSKISEVLQAPGNTRIVEFTLKRGSLYIDQQQETIYFEMTDSHSLYSEPNKEVSVGRIKVLTTEGNKFNTVRLSISYLVDLKLPTDDKIKKYSAASVPYHFSITNNGINANGVTPQILFDEISGA